MPRGPIPEAFHELLEGEAFAFVSTLGRNGEPQVNPMWYLWDNGQIVFSFTEGNRKLENLRRDGRIAVAISNPANPYRYLDVRGRVSSIEPDPDETVYLAVTTRYTGGKYSAEPAGTKRYVARVEVERYTCQWDRPVSTVEG